MSCLHLREDHTFEIFKFNMKYVDSSKYWWLLVRPPNWNISVLWAMPTPHPNAVAGHAFVRSKTSIWMETATPFVEFQFELLTWPEITSSDPILETWSQALEVHRMKRKCLSWMHSEAFPKYPHPLLLKGCSKQHPLGCINLCRRSRIIFLPSQTFQSNIWQRRSGAVQTFIKTF